LSAPIPILGGELKLPDSLVGSADGGLFVPTEVVGLILQITADVAQLLNRAIDARVPNALWLRKH
jgi:hypothetical protein